MTTDRDRKETDGTGAPIVDDAMYYVQDARGAVGNCGSWWAPKGAGYCCDLGDAGLYTGAYVRGMRDTDVPWPMAYVDERVVRHVRVDTQAFRRRDDAYERQMADRRAELAREKEWLEREGIREDDDDLKPALDVEATK